MKTNSKMVIGQRINDYTFNINAETSAQRQICINDPCIFEPYNMKWVGWASEKKCDALQAGEYCTCDGANVNKDETGIIVSCEYGNPTETFLRPSCPQGRASSWSGVYEGWYCPP